MFEKIEDKTMIMLGMFVLFIGAVMDPNVRFSVVIALGIITIALIIRSDMKERFIAQKANRRGI